MLYVTYVSLISATCVSHEVLGGCDKLAMGCLAIVKVVRMSKSYV